MRIYREQPSQKLVRSRSCKAGDGFELVFFPGLG